MIDRSILVRRRGSVLPLVVLGLTGLIGMVALAIDLSMVVLARNQAQNAADSAAMAACRALNGLATGNNNATTAITNGQTAAKANSILSQPIASSDVTVKIGILKYDTSTTPPTFTVPAANLTTSPSTPPSNYNWGAAEVTVTGTVNYTFAKVFGLTSAPVNATAQAIHRPRDLAIILDFSGSMAFDSYMVAPSGSNYPGAGDTLGNSLNPDTVIPKFGHYDPSTTSSTYASLTSSSDYTQPDGEILKQGNSTSTSTSGDPICGDFWTLTGSSTFVNAFNNSGTSPTPVTTYDSSNFPTSITGGSGSNQGGEKPWKVPAGSPLALNTGTTFAKTFGEICNISTAGNSTSRPGTNPTMTQFDQNTQSGHPSNTIAGFSNFETYGYPGPAGTWKGYTYGPGYWGKTFFVWPPNPDSTSNPANPASSTYTNSTNGPGSGPIRDWRQRFFWKFDGSNNRYRLDDDNILWNSNGTMRPPDNSNPYTDPYGTTWTYQINYDAVLWWIQNTGPTGNLFPGNVRSGRILYYDSIPSNVNSTSTDLNQLFWKNYIDYVFGARDYSTAGSPSTTQLSSGFGDDFSWATASIPSQIFKKPSPASGMAASLTAQINNGGGYSSGYNGSIKIDTISSGAPQAGDQVVFASSLPSTATVYTVASYNSGSSKITLTAALAANVSDNQVIQFCRPSYMDYRDNPMRPKMRWWFGPMSFADFLWCDYISFESNGYGRYWRPGTCHEAPTWALKSGVNSALGDIQKNHPNDWVSLIYFCMPKASSSSGAGFRFNRVRTPLGQRYTYMQNSLWYPQSVITSNPGGSTDGNLIAINSSGWELRPYDSSFNTNSAYTETPFALGGTCPAYGFELAYNQFSSNSSVLKDYATTNGLSGAPIFDAGGNGRTGARKMIIFETDGVPNVRTSQSTFQNVSANNSYYKIRQPNEWPSGVSGSTSSADDDCVNVVMTICDNASGNRSGYNTGKPGYSTTNKPVLVHALAFGGLFENSTTETTSAKDFLQRVQYYGGTGASTTTALPSYKIITGDSTTRINKIKTAFTTIMQDGVQVSMFK